MAWEAKGAGRIAVEFVKRFQARRDQDLALQIDRVVERHEIAPAAKVASLERVERGAPAALTCALPAVLPTLGTARAKLRAEPLQRLVWNVAVLIARLIEPEFDKLRVNPRKLGRNILAPLDLSNQLAQCSNAIFAAGALAEGGRSRGVRGITATLTRRAAHAFGRSATSAGRSTLAAATTAPTSECARFEAAQALAELRDPLVADFTVVIANASEDAFEALRIKAGELGREIFAILHRAHEPGNESEPIIGAQTFAECHKLLALLGARRTAPTARAARTWRALSAICRWCYSIGR